MKLIHTADWQLGKPFGRFDPEVRAALTEARFDAIDLIGRAAAEHGAGHVVVAGDIFDTEGPEDRTIVQAISRMGRHPCKWWLLPGNHDFARNGGLWDRLRQRAGDGITVLSEPEPREVEAGIWLLPAPLTYRHNLDDPTVLFDGMETRARVFVSALPTAPSAISEHRARRRTRLRPIARAAPISTTLLSATGMGPCGSMLGPGIQARPRRIGSSATNPVRHLSSISRQIGTST
jgi:hypothetical protein